MLVIRKEQMEVFARIAEENFIDDVAREVRETEADSVEDLSDDDLRKRVKVAVARAARHGLTLELSIIAFVRLMFAIAPNFDEQPNIKQMLADERVEPDDRVELVFRAASDDDWEEAGELYDESAWE